MMRTPALAAVLLAGVFTVPTAAGATAVPSAAPASALKCASPAFVFSSNMMQAQSPSNTAAAGSALASFITANSSRLPLVVHVESGYRPYVSATNEQSAARAKDIATAIERSVRASRPQLGRSAIRFEHRNVGHSGVNGGGSTYQFRVYGCAVPACSAVPRTRDAYPVRFNEAVNSRPREHGTLPADTVAYNRAVSQAASVIASLADAHAPYGVSRIKVTAVGFASPAGSAESNAWLARNRAERLRRDVAAALAARAAGSSGRWSAARVEIVVQPLVNRPEGAAGSIIVSAC